LLLGVLQPHQRTVVAYAEEHLPAAGVRQRDDLPHDPLGPGDPVLELEVEPLAEGDEAPEVVGVHRAKKTALGDRRRYAMSGRSSAFGSRVISSPTASAGRRPSKRMAQTASVIGISTPWRRASARTETAVRTHSTTIVMAPSASATDIPPPIISPKRRFRLCRLKHVTTRSPRPASPKNVSASAPMARPSRLISASPRVTRAAFALSPSPSPSPIPAASAITFLTEPAISTPRRSALT